MMAPTSHVRLIYQDDAIILGAWHNLLITDLRDGIRREHQSEMLRAYRAAEKQFPRGLVSLAILRQDIPVGDASARSESARMMESLAGVIRHIAIVLEGTGIWASTMRTVLRGMSVVARTPYSLNVSPDLQHAAGPIVAKIAELTAERPSENDLFEAVRTLRQLADEASRR